MVHKILQALWLFWSGTAMPLKLLNLSCLGGGT
jgi:hypothetical protein